MSNQLGQLGGHWFTHAPSKCGTVRHWGISSFIAQDELLTNRQRVRDGLEDEAIRRGYEAREYIESGNVSQAAESARLAAGWAQMAVGMTEMYWM